MSRRVDTQFAIEPISDRRPGNFAANALINVINQQNANVDKKFFQNQATKVEEMKFEKKIDIIGTTAEPHLNKAGIAVNNKGGDQNCHKNIRTISTFLQKVALERIKKSSGDKTIISLWASLSHYDNVSDVVIVSCITDKDVMRVKSAGSEVYQNTIFKRTSDNVEIPVLWLVSDEVQLKLKSEQPDNKSIINNAELKKIVKDSIVYLHDCIYYTEELWMMEPSRIISTHISWKKDCLAKAPITNITDESDGSYVLMNEERDKGITPKDFFEKEDIAIINMQTEGGTAYVHKIFGYVYGDEVVRYRNSDKFWALSEVQNLQIGISTSYQIISMIAAKGVIKPYNCYIPESQVSKDPLEKRVSKCMRVDMNPEIIGPVFNMAVNKLKDEPEQIAKAMAKVHLKNYKIMTKLRTDINENIAITDQSILLESFFKNLPTLRPILLLLYIILIMVNADYQAWILGTILVVGMVMMSMNSITHFLLKKTTSRVTTQKVFWLLIIINGLVRKPCEIAYLEVPYRSIGDILEIISLLVVIITAILQVLLHKKQISDNWMIKQVDILVKRTEEEKESIEEEIVRANVEQFKNNCKQINGAPLEKIDQLKLS